MARIASEALIERLSDWGVDTVFGLPGDGTNGIMEGLRRADRGRPSAAGARIRTEVPVIGDAKQTLRAVLPLLKQRSDTSFLSKYQKEMQTWRRKMAALETPAGTRSRRST